MNISIRYFSLISWQKQHCNDNCFSNDAMNTAMLSLSTRSEFQNYRNMYCVSVGRGGGWCACACTKINTLASDICSTFPALIVGGSDFSKQYEVFQFINTTTTHPNLWNVGDLPTRSQFITTTKDMLSPLDFHGYRFLHSWKKPQCRTTLAPVNDINIGLIEL